jgi:hypothetical protein
VSNGDVSKGLGLLLIGSMVYWLLSSNIQPVVVEGRIILGVLLIILGYLMDIATYLKEKRDAAK